MADIICGDGVHLQHDAHTFVPSLQPPSVYDWANEQPSQSNWSLWRAALKILTSQNLSLPFFDSLGHWTELPHTPSKWHYSPTTCCLYKSLLGGHYCYTPQMLTRYAHFEFNYYSMALLPPDSCFVAAYLDRDGCTVLAGWAIYAPHEKIAPTSVRELTATWDDNWALLHSSNFQHADLVVGHHCK